MKKIIVTLLLILTFCGITSFAADVDVLIPDYTVVLNDNEISYKDSLYPLISYKDITYFPMTYEYCRFMGMTTSWVDGKGLWIAYYPHTGAEMYEAPIYEAKANSKYNKATLPEYPIYINGRKIDNDIEEYPLLNFRGVTYFPMTWDYAYNEFCWNTDWKDSILTVNRWFDKNVSFNVVEQNDEYAIIQRWHSFSVWLDENTTTSSGEYKYYKLNFADDSMSEIEYERKNWNTYDIREVEITIQNGKIICEGEELADIEYLKNTVVVPDGFWVNGSVKKFGDVEVYTINVYYPTNAAIVYRSNESYQYLKTEDGFVRFNGEFSDEYDISNAVKCGDDYYICGQKRAWKTNHWNFELFRIDKDNNITYINDLFPDHFSVKLLGEHNGKIYLRNLWCPTNIVQVYGSQSREVSAYNDGYFLYDGQHLEKIAPYIHCNEEIISSSGKLYSLIDWKDEVKRMY
ncbi:MAG: hypothetical protein IKA17_08195 [Clostridia bacterium]|nr:hypothetical protein [Clostridia bacterium]